MTLQLSSQCEQLLNMPSLSNSTEDVQKNFASSSGAVCMMAEEAHKEELKSLELPWWKRSFITEEEMEL